MKIKPHFSALLATTALTLALTTSAHASLLGRDINGNAVAGNAATARYLYDTDLNITWLRDSYSASFNTSYDNSDSSTDGLMTWANANDWANDLDFGGYSDWRLPTTTQPDATCDLFTDHGSTFGTQSYGYNCKGSEMGHLWYTELSNTNTIGPMTNVGDFQNLQSYAYWSGTDFAPNTRLAWIFYTNGGYQWADFTSYSYTNHGTNQFYALAVRPGDVLDATVPEPGTALLAAVALAGLGVMRRRRAVGSSAL